MSRRTSGSLLAHALLLGCGLFTLSSPVPAEVFINELHYDNSGADVGEALEIIATAGEDLGGYRVHLYNGSNAPGSAPTYGSFAVPAAQTRACGATVGIATVTWPRDGLQNGSHDGIALVDGLGRVVQFISYEGTIVAGNGPAAGMTSQSLPVSETASTAVGTSLQLQGTGAAYADFSWAGSSAQTFGSCNAQQTFAGGGGGNELPTVLTTTPVAGATDFPAAGDLSVGFSEPVSLVSGAFALSCATSGNVALSHASSGDVFAISTNTALHGGEACSLTVHASKVSDLQGAHPLANTTVAFNVASSGGSGDYYARVNTGHPGQLRCSLHETIRGHTAYPYSGGGTDSWAILEIADEDPNNPDNVLDAYRNRSYVRGGARAGTGSGLTYNREHSWPNSLGFSSRTGDKGLPHSPYTDTHMLYLTDTDYNSARGNKPYAPCPSSANCGARATEANNGFGGGPAASDRNWVNSSGFEVWDHRKGDMARAVLYMAIRYEGGRHPVTDQSEPDLELTDDRSKIVTTSSSPAYMGLLSTLLAWHAGDPPDAAERIRNEVIHSFQGNRNPFIDHPEWASAALFTSAKPATCQLAN